MKVCLLSHSDGRGGGYAAAYRLHQGLVATQQIEAKMWVGQSERDDERVLHSSNKADMAWTRVSPTLGNIPKLLYPDRERTVFSLAWMPDRLLPAINALNPDLINLHWVNAEFMNVATLARFKRPLVWTLHDMWPFTGGCHYSQDCDRYRQSCGQCPQLGSHRDGDLSRWVWKRKQKAWRDLPLTIVTPSRWLADCARASSLFRDKRIEVIANGVDLGTYRPIPVETARNLLKLPLDRQLILFSGLKAVGDPRKGFPLLASALQSLHASHAQDIELVVLGASRHSDSPDLGFKTHYLGRCNDDLTLALAYSAADVLVTPSREDNLPNVVIEALACGTPCVAFKIGGMPDMIDHQSNGYLAQPFEIEDLARGIVYVLSDRQSRSAMRQQARKKVEQEFSLERQVQRYTRLFEEVVTPNPSQP